jgi:hypothetical protein
MILSSSAGSRWIISDQAADLITNPLMDSAWTILEAANDLGHEIVEVCRRVIDGVLRRDSCATGRKHHFSILRMMQTRSRDGLDHCSFLSTLTS